MEVCIENSCLEGDSNALVMPAKKRNKRKAINQDAAKGVGKNKYPKLNKSQQNKLKKLEEEKEKSLLLKKSIETLEKYKIPEDAFSLLQSSKNISRVQTVKEKRRMAIQFSKAGLEVPGSDLSFKMSDGASWKTEAESWENITTNELIARDAANDSSDSLIADQELGSCNNEHNSNHISNCGSVSTLSTEEVPFQENLKPNKEDTKNSSPTPHHYDARKTTQIMMRA